MTTTSRRTGLTVTFITVTAVMAALACISNLLRIPLGESKISISNAVCILCGLILGPLGGFLSAGLGNFLFDIFTGYGFESLITFVSKGAIAWTVAALTVNIRRRQKPEPADMPRLYLAGALAALTYVALYMLKTFIFGLAVNGLTMEGTLAKMVAKLPASLINAAFGAVVAPTFYMAVIPALRHTGVLEKM